MNNLYPETDTTAKAAREPGIMEQLQQIEKVTVAFCEVVSSLEEILSPILRPGGPQPGGANTPIPPAVKVKSILAAHQRNIAELMTRVAEIRARIEL